MRKLIIILMCFVFSSIVNAQQQDTINIFFDIDKSEVTNAHARQLDKVTDNRDNITSISILGYTDFLGSEAYNQVLSQERSGNIKNYLLSKGISKNLISASLGKGIYPNSSEQARTDKSDKGILKHRMVQVIYTYESAGQFSVVEVEEPVISIVKSTRKTMEENLSEENLEVGKNIVLEDIFFFNNSDTFRPESDPTLKLLLKTMENNPTLKIEIQGYACCTPTPNDVKDKHAAQVTSMRAIAVYNYLIKNGIKSNRMTHKGFGRTNKRFPLERNEYEMNMNRRVEIKILEK